MVCDGSAATNPAQEPADPSLNTAWRMRADYVVSNHIMWSHVHRTTRLHATVSTFGWRTKIVLTSPPFLTLGFWTLSGAFNNGAIAIGFGLPMLWASLWWVRQVWVAGPADRPATPKVGPEPNLRFGPHPAPLLYEQVERPDSKLLY